MPNQKYSRDELIDTLRRHLQTFKDDEHFAQSIMDIAAFLVEYRAYKRRNSPEPATDTGEQRRLWLRTTEQRDEEIKMVLERYNRQRPANCNLCGAPTEGHAMCPNCGNMAI